MQDTAIKSSIQDAKKSNISNPLLEAIDLTKRYEDGVLALDHVSFTVDSGQIYTMLGANGAGKTTAINLFLNFIEQPKAKLELMGFQHTKTP